MDPMAQHSVLSTFQLYSLPLSWFDSFSNICVSVSLWSRCAR